MRIDLTEAFGPEPAIIPVRIQTHSNGFPPMRVKAFRGHPLMGRDFLVSDPTLPSKPPTRDSFPLLSSDKEKPNFHLIAPRRRSKA